MKSIQTMDLQMNIFSINFGKWERAKQSFALFLKALKQMLGYVIIKSHIPTFVLEPKELPPDDLNYILKFSTSFKVGIATPAPGRETVIAAAFAAISIDTSTA